MWRTQLSKISGDSGEFCDSGDSCETGDSVVTGDSVETGCFGEFSEYCNSGKSGQY